MREEIIGVAVKLLDNFGVKFTIEDIAKAVGISKKTVYKYFDGKEALAKAVFTQIVEAAKSKQSAAVGGGLGKREALIAYLLEYMEIYRLSSKEIFNLFSLSNRLLVGVKQKIDENWAGFEAIYDASSLRQSVCESGEILKIIVEGTLNEIYHTSDRRQKAKDCLKVILR